MYVFLTFSPCHPRLIAVHEAPFVQPWHIDSVAYRQFFSEWLPLHDFYTVIDEKFGPAPWTGDFVEGVSNDIVTKFREKKPQWFKFIEDIEHIQFILPALADPDTNPTMEDLRSYGPLGTAPPDMQGIDISEPMANIDAIKGLVGRNNLEWSHTASALQQKQAFVSYMS